MVISNEKTLDGLVAESPGPARILEKYRIDHCSGGKHALSAACRERGITQIIRLRAKRGAICNQAWTVCSDTATKTAASPIGEEAMPT